MTCNVGGVERPVRMVLAVLLLGLAIFGGMPPVGAWAVGVLAAIALVTGTVGFCPAWKLLGVNTCPSKPAEKG